MQLTRRAALGTIALLAAACGRPAAPGEGAASAGAEDGAAGPLPDPHALAETYVRLTLRLAQHQPSLVETWLGPADWKPGARGPVAAIRQEIGALRVRLRTALDTPGRALDEARLVYLSRQAHALETAARRLMGETFTFAEEALDALGVQGFVDASKRLDHVREDLARVLPGRGPLVERLVRFQRANAVPPDRLDRAVAAAVAACRAATLEHIALPEGEQVDLGTQDNLGLEGWAVYQGGYRTRILIERAAPTDIARLVWLAAHEAYPGHHTQYVLADRDLVQAHDWRERQLHVSFGEYLLVSEGVAETGAGLLLEGDAFEKLCRDAVLPVAGVPAAGIARLIAVKRTLATLAEAVPEIGALYLDGTLGSEAAAARLREEAVIPNADAFLMTIEKQRTRVLAYTEGRKLTRIADTETEPWTAVAKTATLLRRTVGEA